MINIDDANVSATNIGVEGVTLAEIVKVQHCILDSIYNPILAVDAEGRIIFCNRAMALKTRSNVSDGVMKVTRLLANNPRAMTVADAREIYLKVL